MNEEDYKRRMDWYESGGTPPDGHAPQEPADAAPISTPPPLRSAGSPSSAGAEPYWSEAGGPPPRKKSTALRVTGICLCVLILIAATAVAFSSKSPKASPGTAVPAATNSPEASSPSDYDNFQSFFDSYYGTDDTESSEAIEIPAAETGTGAVLDLTDAPDTGELTLQEIYEKCIDSVVAITAATSDTSYSWGTGVVLTQDGYIVTNTHVLEGASSATLTLQDNTQYTAKLVGADSISDIAVLKIEAEGLKPAEFASKEAVVGDDVVAIGNPLGEEFRGTMTNGIISAISRNISYNNHTMTLLQTNAELNEGNSGGPLINMYGQVIGITNMKMMTSSSYSNVEGIGFAIPVSTVKTVVDSLIANGKVTGRPMIGITVGAIPEAAAEYYKLPAGLYITAVSDGSDAQAKGVTAGDILTAVNGVSVSATADVTAAMEGLAAGDSLTLTIYRSGEYFDVEVLLVESSDIY